MKSLSLRDTLSQRRRYTSNATQVAAVRTSSLGLRDAKLRLSLPGLFSTMSFATLEPIHASRRGSCLRDSPLHVGRLSLLADEKSYVGAIRLAVLHKGNTSKQFKCLIGSILSLPSAHKLQSLSGRSSTVQYTGSSFSTSTTPSLSKR